MNSYLSGIHSKSALFHIILQKIFHILQKYELLASLVLYENSKSPFSWTKVY